MVSFSAPEVLNRCLTGPEVRGGVRTGLVAGYWVRKMEWSPSRRAHPALERGAGWTRRSRLQAQPGFAP